MNTNQFQTLEKVFIALNQGIVVHAFGETMVVNTPQKITNPISFKSSSVMQMLCFLWSNAKNRVLVISDDQRTHRITIMPYREHGSAKFTLEIVLLKEGSASCKVVENLLPATNRIARTQQASYPSAATKLMACDWFCSLKALLIDFNSKNIAIA